MHSKFMDIGGIGHLINIEAKGRCESVFLLGKRPEGNIME